MGGINDMAAWTRLAWDNNMAMAVNGTDSCVFDDNPLEIVCGDNAGGKINHGLGPYPAEKVRRAKRAFFEHLRDDLGIKDLHEFGLKNVKVEKNGRGILMSKKDDVVTNDKKVEDVENFAFEQKTTAELVATLGSDSPYANFGWSLHVDDLNGDGQDELIIGAPGLFCWKILIYIYVTEKNRNFLRNYEQHVSPTYPGLCLHYVRG